MLDGVKAARFLGQVKQLIETPQELLKDETAEPALRAARTSRAQRRARGAVAVRARASLARALRVRRRARAAAASCSEARSRGRVAATRCCCSSTRRVITLGRRTDVGHLRSPRRELARARRRGAPTSRRGGDVTYHGPGQLVGYPIVDLAARGAADVRTCVPARARGGADRRARRARPRGASARRRVFAGVWLGRARASSPRSASACARWVTLHGFALNVDVRPRALRARSCRAASRRRDGRASRARSARATARVFEAARAQVERALRGALA